MPTTAAAPPRSPASPCLLQGSMPLTVPPAPRGTAGAACAAAGSERAQGPAAWQGRGAADSPPPSQCEGLRLPPLLLLLWRPAVSSLT